MIIDKTPEKKQQNPVKIGKNLIAPKEVWNKLGKTRFKKRFPS